MPSPIIPSAGRHPITPPLSAIPETDLLSSSLPNHQTEHLLASASNKSLAAPRPNLSSATPKGIKRRASDETIVSATPKSNAKRAKTIRSSSQPPAALRDRMARPRDSATPELDEDGMPVRYTPTTGRISKAKKGLPVHYCQYGCGKVYTRAEHRKRHEANHRKDALFRCDISDCDKEFQRIDLFQRHMEKQWVPEPQVQVLGNKFAANSQRHGQGANQSDRARASSVTSSLGSSDPASIVEQLAMPTVAAQMGLGLTTPPDSSTFPAYTMEQQQNQMSWAGFQQMHGLESPSPETFPEAYSPSLRHAGSQIVGIDPRTGRTMSAPPTGMQTTFGDSMSQGPSTSGSVAWPATTYWQQSSVSAASEFDAYRAVDEPGRHTSSHGMEHATGTDFSTPAGAIHSARAAGMVELDAEHLKHYHECYWTHFDPLFPIVHRSSYSPANADSGLLGVMILAIGAQFSPRSGAAAHSVNSFSIARSIIEEEVDLSSLAANLDLESLRPVVVTKLQGIFLWEYFAVYRSQQTGVHKSKHFAALYNHLLAADSITADDRTYRLASTNTGGAEHDDVSEYTSWLLRESLRRLLLACFILDTHRSTFFHQPASRPLAPDAILPRPCADAIWTADSLSAWEEASLTGRTSPTPTPFKINLGQALNLHLTGRVNLSSIMGTEEDFMDSSDSVAADTASLTAWTLQLASVAPIRALLTVAAEGSYVGLAVSDTEWVTAKSRLRAWSASPAATSDIHAAGRILTIYFAHESDSALLGVGLELDWSLYIAALTLWAYTNANALTSTNISPPAAGSGKGKTPMSPPQSMPQTLGAGVMQASQSSDPAQRMEFLPSQPMSPPDLPRSAPYGYVEGANVDPVALQNVLQALNVTDAGILVSLKGQGGSAPVLKAVHSVIMDGGLNMMKGQLLMEASTVLGILVDVEEGRRAGSYLSF